jgi:3-oxoacyl-[acyl-carrier-protein] synthase III
MSDNAVIRGLGFALPEQVWDNDRLAQMVDTSDEWIRTRTGISTRHIAAAGESTADFATSAAINALADANMSAEDIDLVIVATMTPETIFPATACYVQDRIGAVNAGAFDISAACTGFVYGLAVGSSMVRSGTAGNVLVVGAETLSRFVDWEDRNTCVLFGDGAGAAVISSDGSGGRIIDSILHSDGSRSDLLFMPAGGAQLPASEETVNNRMHYIKMTGKGLYKEATTSMADAVREVLNKNGLTVDDMDLLIPHQANLRIILSTAKKLEIPPEKAYVNIDRYGNTSAATIPIALTEALADGSISAGDTVVIVGFGSGMTWGASLIRF